MLINHVLNFIKALELTFISILKGLLYYINSLLKIKKYSLP